MLLCVLYLMCIWLLKYLRMNGHEKIKKVMLSFVLWCVLSVCVLV